jgi:hypothetical protein
MHRLRRLHRPSAWTALLAVLAMALVPSLARALAHGQGAGVQWVEVCTAQGMKLVAVADHGATEPGDTPHTLLPQLEHCPLCTLGHGGPALPSAAFALQPPPAAARAVATRFLHAPRTLYAWRSAQPRGPPFQS